MNHYCVAMKWDNARDEFIFMGGPIDEKCDAVMLALGYIGASWARLEKHINVLIIQINKAQHSTEELNLYDPDHPSPLWPNLRY